MEVEHFINLGGLVKKRDKTIVWQFKYSKKLIQEAPENNITYS